MPELSYTTKTGRKRYRSQTKRYPPEEEHRQCRSYRERNPVRYLLTQAKYRAKKKGIEFNVSMDDLDVPTHCPVFGFELTTSNGRREHSSFSIDRFDNSKGYVPGNVRIISWKANQYKGDMTIPEVEQLLSYMKGNV